MYGLRHVPQKEIGPLDELLVGGDGSLFCFEFCEGLAILSDFDVGVLDDDAVLARGRHACNADSVCVESMCLRCGGCGKGNSHLLKCKKRFRKNKRESGDGCKKFPTRTL